MRIASFLLLATSLLGADNPWAKVQELKSGAELRIYKKGASQPVEARFDEVTEERLLIVVKNEQKSIPKEDIDRIDARPVKKEPRKMHVESTVKETDPDFTPHPNPGIPAPGTSYNSGVSFSGGGKPDFEIVYQRAGNTPAKK